MRWNISSCSVTGSAKAKNQDRVIIERDQKSGIALVAILDGHGKASDIVDYGAKRIPELFHAEFERNPVSLIRTLGHETENYVEGSTISVAFLHPDGTASAASLGDSPVIWGKLDRHFNIFAHDQLRSHNVSANPDEVTRLRRLGAKITSVYFEDSRGRGLQFARTLGDVWAKKFIDRTPEVMSVTLREHDYLLLASDGLFDVGPDIQTTWMDWTRHAKKKMTADDLMFSYADRIRIRGDDTSVIICYPE